MKSPNAIVQALADALVETAFQRAAKRVIRRGIGLHNSPQPCRPTVAMPGSEAKIAVLCQRAADRQELFHAQDAKDDPR